MVFVFKEVKIVPRWVQINYMFERRVNKEGIGVGLNEK